MDTATSAVFHGFPARAYLDKYYRRVGAENTVLLHAVGDFVRAHRGPTASLIEVAGGPSLFTTMAVAAERGLRFERLTFTDIAWQNLEEVRWWLADDPRGFDYSELLAWLASERGRDPGLVVETLRGSRWDLVQRDWLVADDASFDGSYDVVSSHFFAESATSSEDEFLSMLAKVGRLGRPGALVLLSFMCSSAGYRIGGCDFPAFAVDEASVLDHLDRAGLELTDLHLRSVPAEGPAEELGYDGLLFLGGRIAS